MKTGTRLLLLSALLLGVVHLLVLPPWMGEDEPWHFDYVSNVADGHRPLFPWERGPVWKKEWLEYQPAGVHWAQYQLGISAEEALATQHAVVASLVEHDFAARVDHDPRHAAPETWDEVQGSGGQYHAYNQPPLYYALCGAVVALSGADGVEARLHVARALSLVAYLAVVLATVALARLVTPDERVVLLAGAVAAWLPMHARQAAVVNNDVLVKVFVAGALWFAARFTSGRTGPRDLALAALCLGAGLVTKTTAAATIAVLGGALLLRRGLPVRVWTAAVVGLAVLLGAAVLYWSVSSNPAVPRTLERLFARVDQGFSLARARHLLVTTVGTTNWESRWLPDPAYAVLGTALVGGLLAALLQLVAGARAWCARRLLLLCLLAVGAQLLLIGLHGEAHGRYLLPVLPALATLVAVGLAGLVPERGRGAAVVALAAFFVAFEAAFLWGALVVNEHLVLGA